MKIKLAAMIAAFVLLINLSGCKSADVLGQYKNAVNNTNSIKNASVSSDFHITLDTAQSNLTDKMRNQLEIYSDIKGYVTTSFDKDKKIIKMKGHMDIKSIGFDFEIFENKDKTVILFPLFPKYMAIDKSFASKGFMGFYFDSGEIESDSLSKRITKENIKKLDNSIISTPEGELKAYNYNISVTGDMLKQKYKSIIDYVLNSSELRNLITEVAVNAKIEGINNSNKDDIFRGLNDRLNKYVEGAEIYNPNYSAAWDKDYVIREEKETFDVNYKIDSENSIKMNITSTTKRWNIGKNTDTQMIGLNNENSFSINETDNNIPPFYKNILKNIKK